MRHVGCGQACRVATTDRLAALAATIALALLSAYSAHAAWSAEDVPALERLDNVVTPDDFARIVDMLNLTDDQRAAVQSLYDVYFELVDAIAHESHRSFESVRPRIRQIRSEARERGETVRTMNASDWDEIGELNRSHQVVRRRLLREADRHLDDFLAGLRRSLASEQAAVVDELPRHIRRWNLERFYSRSHGTWSDFNYPFVLEQLVADALKDGVLSMLSDDALVASADADHATARERLDAILETHDRLLDVLHRQPRLASFRAPIPENYGQPVTLTPERHLRRAEQWSKRYDTSYDAARKIAALLVDVHGDERIGQAWVHEFRRRMAPSIIKEWWAEGMVDWLSRRSDATPEQLQVAEELLDRFQAERPALEMAAYEAAVAARRRRATILVGESEVLEAFFAKVHALNELHTSTLLRFREILSDDQLPAFQSAMLFVRSYRRQVGNIQIPLSISPMTDPPLWAPPSKVSQSPNE